MKAVNKKSKEIISFKKLNEGGIISYYRESIDLQYEKDTGLSTDNSIPMDTSAFLLCYTPLIKSIRSLNEYQLLAARTLPDLKEFYGNSKVVIDDMDLDCNQVHAFYGIDTEFGEILDLYKKSFAYRKVFDKVNLIEEVCDIIWYCAAGCSINNEPIEDVIDFGNISFKGYIIPSVDYPTPQNMADAYNIIDSYRKGIINIEDVIGGFISSEEELLKGLTNNINKLIVRYPDKFDNIQAINRDLDSERKQLEQ